MPILSIAMAQFHSKLGDFEGNADKIIEYIEQAQKAKCDLVAAPELALCGYPPQDLVFNSAFIAKNKEQIARVASATKTITAVVGFVDSVGGDVFNAAAICSEGKVQTVVHKQCLPNYGIFDEKRTFTSGQPSSPIEVSGVKVGVMICYDAWTKNSPAHALSKSGAEFLLSINASPFRDGKAQVRHKTLTKLSQSTGLPLAYVNRVGAQDGLVFDGSSGVYSGDSFYGEAGSTFTEGLLVTTSAPTTEAASTDSQELLFKALASGVKSYCHDNGFKKVCLGLSGGIDSAMTLVIAAKALGPENVTAILMPSRYSSDHSVSDSIELCGNLGVDSHTIEIEQPHAAFESVFNEATNGLKPLAGENLQSRLRGVTLMTFANQYDQLVLATGNKTEMAVGYSTLYGDTVGAYAVIGDLWKTQVYELAAWYNKTYDNRLPQHIITKQPSAELAPGQFDTDSLPDYETLDAICELYVEEHFTQQNIIEAGHDPEIVSDILAKIERSEYKRRQTPLCSKVSKMTFGTDRRIPITNNFVES